MFSRVAIVGVGLIGGSLGMALRAGRFSQQVVGVGRNPATLEKAVGLRAIDTFTTDFAQGVSDADLVVLATPVGQILADLGRLAPLLKPGAVVTDVGSSKQDIAHAGDAHLPGGAFVAGHPMAGSERAGVEAARPDLFQEATWALTPTDRTDDKALQSVRRMAQALGARVLTLSAEEHDRCVAVTSHLPHVLAYALSAIAGEQAGTAPHLYDLAAGSFASGTRVAASPPELWHEIAMTNRNALAEAVRACRAELDLVLLALETGDSDALLAAFRRGNEARQQQSDVV